MDERFNIVGHRYGKLTVISHDGSSKYRRLWKCLCDCGNERYAFGFNLKNGTTHSCGCANRSRKHGHGGNGKKRKPSKTYSSWQNMIARCNHPSNPAYEHYKKRGISMCVIWLTFVNFLEDMGVRPENTTLDRRDNDGNYEPDNCRWATKREQANNRITNIKFSYKGKEYSLADLARHTGASKEMLRSRLCRSKLPWTVEGAVNTPLLPKTMTRAGFYK